MSQSSFYSLNDPRLHFGLGSAISADLEVIWPNGNKESCTAVGCDKLITIHEGTGVVPNVGWSR